MNLVIQWHITEQCNWRCTHCYHDQYLEKGPSLKELKNTFNQILNIKKGFFGEIQNRFINFAGGEPLIRKDFLDLLKYINSKVKFMKIGILTNGSFLTEKFLDELDKLKNLKFNIQISIEGRKNINDKIRGEGTYDLICDKIELLKNRNIIVNLSFTLTKYNKEEVFRLVPLIKKYGIVMGVRRIVPMGQSKEEYDLMLSKEEWYKFSIKVFNINFSILNKKEYGKIGLNGCSEVTSYKYSGTGCAINEHRILIIMHNFDIYSCRRLPIVLGNLNKNSLEEIYLGKEYLEQIESSNYIDICKKCPYYNKCRGGAKCITYAKEKTLKKEDPQCFFAKLLKDKG